MIRLRKARPSRRDRPARPATEGGDPLVAMSAWVGIAGILPVGRGLPTMLYCSECGQNLRAAITPYGLAMIEWSGPEYVDRCEDVVPPKATNVITGRPVTLVCPNPDCRRKHCWYP
jgi:hypothetical protein